MDTTWQHTTVLLSEAVDSLLTQPDQTYVDATFGRGGHSRLILSHLGPQGRLIAIDRDPDAIRTAQSITDPRFEIHHHGFAELRQAVPAGQQVAGILMDLGVSSPQIDNPERGFSFRHDGPLDMRMDSSRGQSVAQWLAVAEVQQIAEVIRDYGEERFAVPIAKAIVARRQQGSLPASTLELAEIVAGAVKTREPGQNPATRTFQAFRIFINAELEELQQALEASLHEAACAGPHQARRGGNRRQSARPQRRDARGAEDRGMTRLNLVLLLALLCSAMYLVHVQYESRRLFIELERATAEARRLEQENDSLEVERRTQATPLRVEKLAKEKLQMRTATPAITQYLTYPERP